ncbi:hypothetical protein B0J11DRAFT_40765 [Dendryphion nanum]|uniref:Transmembrane protein n=1 Tax=Dendryphion nanum TaxID=256645 RepID=A0A9P9EJG2_9PLEO|nr:hypothetical protein B0J11DRAFT_40765 [Dendryphion nanum]
MQTKTTDLQRWNYTNTNSPRRASGNMATHKRRSVTVHRRRSAAGMIFLHTTCAAFAWRWWNEYLLVYGFEAEPCFFGFLFPLIFLFYIRRTDLILQTSMAIYYDQRIYIMKEILVWSFWGDGLVRARWRWRYF